MTAAEIANLLMSHPLLLLYILLDILSWLSDLSTMLAQLVMNIVDTSILVGRAYKTRTPSRYLRGIILGRQEHDEQSGQEIEAALFVSPRLGREDRRYGIQR